MIRLKLPDGGVHQAAGGISGKELVAGLEPALKKEVICLWVTGTHGSGGDSARRRSGVGFAPTGSVGFYGIRRRILWHRRSQDL